MDGKAALLASSVHGCIGRLGLVLPTPSRLLQPSKLRLPLRVLLLQQPLPLFDALHSPPLDGYGRGGHGLRG